MSLPILKPTNTPSYLNTDLKELKEEVKKLLEVPIIKISQSPRKSPSENKNSASKRRIRDVTRYFNQEYDNIPTPRLNEHIHMLGIPKTLSPNNIINHTENITMSLINTNDLNTEINKIPEINTTKSKGKHREPLEPVITEKHGSHFINDKPKLPPIGKKSGKRRTRKYKSNLRKTLRKNK
jgi:hypothetical protein